MPIPVPARLPLPPQSSVNRHPLIALRTPVALVLFLALGACSPSAQPAKAAEQKGPTAPPLVRVAPLELRKVRRTIETSGYLQSMHEVLVQSRVSARVLSVEVKRGERVKAGRVLARLDDREARSALRQSEVQLADRKVKHDLAKLAADTAARRYEAARIEREKAKAQYERNAAIDPALIPQKDLDDSRFGLESAEEALRIAEVEKRRAEIEVTAALNAIAEMEAAVDAAQIRVSEHVIVSPLDGVVSEQNIFGGETISPAASTASSATPLFKVVDDQNLRCDLQRPQRELPMIRGAKLVTFTTDAVPNHEFRAEIAVIIPVVDQASGSFVTQVHVIRDDDMADLLRPGMFIRARILAEDEREALLVAKAAVLNEGAVSAVFVVRNGVARRVVLDPGIEEREFLEARNLGEDGLSKSDVVVVSGQQGLQDKTAVEVSKT